MSKEAKLWLFGSCFVRLQKSLGFGFGYSYFNGWDVWFTSFFSGYLFSAYLDLLEAQSFKECPAEKFNGIHCSADRPSPGFNAYFVCSCVEESEAGNHVVHHRFPSYEDCVFACFSRWLWGCFNFFWGGFSFFRCFNLFSFLGFCLFFFWQFYSSSKLTLKLTTTWTVASYIYGKIQGKYLYFQLMKEHSWFLSIFTLSSSP